MTLNWDLIIDETSLAAVLPREWAHFAAPVRDGLTVFLSGLPEQDQIATLRAQSALPTTATISERLGLLARGSPVLQKLGQILSRDQRLAPELRCQLRQLESFAPTVPLEQIRETLSQELGSLKARDITLVPPAIAEASVAVVIPFHSPRHTSSYSDTNSNSGANDACARHVFKVLKPGIEERLECELMLLDRVGQHLDERCDDLSIPHLDYQASFQRVRDKLKDEVKLDNEQRHLEQAKLFFAGEPGVCIPRVLQDFSTKRVTAMERVSGQKITGHAITDTRRKRRLAGLVVRALIAMPLLSRTDRALFHCDPHAGNLFLTDEGQLAILDWSLVGTLGESERIAMAQIVLSAIALDARRIVSVLGQIADRERLDARVLKNVVSAWLRPIRCGHLPGLTWLIGMLDDATQKAGLRVGADLMLFRKSLHTLEGVVTEVGGTKQRIDEVLTTEFLKQFAAEWPQRWLHLPNSRDFPSRISNFDLTRTMLSTGAAAARFWTGHTVDLLEACAGGRGTGGATRLAHYTGVMMPVKSLNHIGIAVQSIDAQKPFYEEVLGLDFEGLEDVPSQRVRVAFFRAGDVRIELLEPTSSDSAVAKFLDRRGEGLHHLAFSVEDINARIAELKTSGLRMIDDEPRPGAHHMRIAFVHPKSSFGVLTELCEPVDD